MRRIIGSNISLDRFYSDNQTENIINELINLSSPDPYKKTFFLWPEGIIPNMYLDELKILINEISKSIISLEKQISDIKDDVKNLYSLYTSSDYDTKKNY